MDNEVIITQLKEKVQSFCEERDWDQFHNPKDLAIGIITEAGELLDHFRFKTDQQMKEMLKDSVKRKEIGEEIADIFFFILRFVQMYDMDLAEELEQKIEKNEQKYPVEKCKGSNMKYTEVE